MRTGQVFAVGALLVLLVGVAPAFASSPQSNLSLTMSGAILDSGSQNYYHMGGQLVAANVAGIQVDANHANLRYSLQAMVSEQDVSGSASFSLVAQDSHGSQLSVSGSAKIAGMIPAECFDGTGPVDCAQPYTSAIPGAFLGEANVMVQDCQGSDHTGHCNTLLKEAVPMTFESAFLNPFGGPIFMASDDGAIFIVASYFQSRVTWTGIQLGGTITGSLAESSVAGVFQMTVSAIEDLRAGYELDHGTIAFQSSNPAVSAAGSFVGRSTIPAGSPCPSSLGFPAGTCQITGFDSAGVFSQTNSLGGMIVGKYATTWSAPAVAFTSQVQAIVNQH